MYAYVPIQVPFTPYVAPEPVREPTRKPLYESHKSYADRLPQQVVKQQMAPAGYIERQAVYKQADGTMKFVTVDASGQPVAIAESSVSQPRSKSSSYEDLHSNEKQLSGTQYR